MNRKELLEIVRKWGYIDGKYLGGRKMKDYLGGCCDEG